MPGFDDDVDDVMRACVEEFGNGKFLHIKSGALFDGIFDANHITVELVEGQEISTVRPAIKAHRKDFTQQPKIGDSIRNENTGQTFVIRDVQPDSGFALVILVHLEK